MTDAGIDSKDLDKLLAALDKFPRQVDRAMRVTIRGAAEMVRDQVAVYPSQSAANVPPGINGYSWYERGFGTRTVTGRAYATSQALGRSWATKVRTIVGGWQAEVGTDVNYAPFVQGDKQAGFHRARGWQTVDQVVKKMTPQVVRFVGKAIDKVLARFGA